MPMGVASHEIRDNQITASSHADIQHLPHFGRLLGDNFWAPNPSDDNPWIQVSLDHQSVFSGVVVDGQLDLNVGWIWVDNFYVTYSADGKNWKSYVYFTNNEKVTKRRNS